MFSKQFCQLVITGSVDQMMGASPQKELGSLEAVIQNEFEDGRPCRNPQYTMKSDWSLKREVLRIETKGYW